MADEYNQALCDERHKNVELQNAQTQTIIKEFKVETKDAIKQLFNRLNWFYIIAIATLIGIVATFFKV